MGIVANYQPIQDDPVELRLTVGPRAWEGSFTLADRARLDRKAVLQTKYKTQPNADGLKLRFQINGHEIDTVGPFTGVERGTMLEIFSGPTLEQGLNHVDVDIVEGTGGVTFSDLVCWHKVDD